MSTWRLASLFTLVLLAILPAAGWGQMPPSYAIPYRPSPLLYSRFNGPAGMRVTFYQGTTSGKSFDAPVVAGLRPGYIYRVKLTNLPDRPEAALYPTIEIRGSLQPHHGQRAIDHPVPITFSEDDIERALRGMFLTRVVVLENPEKALPVATQPGETLESFVPGDRDILDEARQRGRVMAIIRMGELEVSAEDMVRHSIAGTIFLPGDQGLASPRVPPQFPWVCWPVVDPILGPRPLTEECLQDGGDRGPRAGIGPDGRLGGVDPADTVAEYTDVRGQRRVVCSNMVCLCVPRFAVLREETRPVGHELIVGVERTGTVISQALIRSRQPSLETQQHTQPQGMNVRSKPSANVSVVSLLALEHGQPAPQIVGLIEELRVVGQVQPPGELTAALDKCCPPDKPLVLCKTVDRDVVQIGDVVTFLLKYTNRGGKPITHVAVTDSLTARLEYVFGSAKADRDSVFTIQENEAGSVILRWEIGGTVLPGQGGVIRFQARIR